jgi:hypothetical protein
MRHLPLRGIISILRVLFCLGAVTVTAIAAAQTTILKPPFHGLLSMGNINFHLTGGIPDNAGDLAAVAAEPAGTFVGLVINLTWAQLEPTQDTFDFSSLDQALAEVSAYNTQNPNTPLGVRLRIWPGPTAPAWIKALDGFSPVTVFVSGNPVTVGPFWTPAYGQAWRTLQTQLADQYDPDPLIQGVSVTSCSTGTDEPFVLPTDQASLNNLHTAGFDDASYQKCLRNAVNDYDGWQTTYLDFPISPFQLTDSTTIRKSFPFTMQIIDLWKAKKQSQGILSNHGLNSPVRTSLIPIYSAFQEIGPLIEFQMYSPALFYWDNAISYAISNEGATAIELWPSCSCYAGGFADVPQTNLQQWSVELQANPE